MQIPDSPDAEPATFLDCDIDSLPPLMFLPDGEPFIPPGPVHITEIARKKRVRYVKLEIYRYAYCNGFLSLQVCSSAYAWQGDNGILHLYQAPVALAETPEFMELEPGHSDTYVRLMQAMGHIDAFIDQ